MIEINVSEFYNQPQYYPYMPADIFNALEQAYIDGRDTARVPVVMFDDMMNKFNSASV